MSYIFKGTICGRLCDDCEEDLSNVQVKLYRVREDQPETVLATANPKDTFSILSEKKIEAKKKSLLTTAETDDRGRFQVELGDNQDYEGEAFEIDVYVEKAPGQDERPEDIDPVQVTITTLQPKWRQSEERFRAVWDYCIPHRFWCKVREQLDAWIICGHVRVCESQEPLAGLTVRAIDVDWTQDDPLGSGVTDGDGRFKIYYSSSDFRKTPFSPLIDIELIGGPDLIFEVESGGSLLPVNPEETRARGRQSDRENVGPCFCVELCVETEGGPPVNEPRFTRVGDFHILSDIDSGTGLTNKEVLGHGGPNYGFHRNLKLYGFCPKTLPADSSKKMKYRFLYEDMANDPGNEVPITGNLVEPVKIGSRLIQWDLDGSGTDWTFQSIVLAGSGDTPDPTPTPSVPPGTPWGPVPDHVIKPDDDGWITVEQDALDSGFFTLMNFRTKRVQPEQRAPGDGAGTPVSDPKNGIPMKLIFEAEPVGGGPPTFRDELPNILINNWVEVKQLDLQQFIDGGSDCTPITTELDVKYTVDHELLASWGLEITSAAFSPDNDDIPSPYSNPIRNGSSPRGEADTIHLDVSDNTKWPSCSYKVWLSNRRALTNGEEDDSGDRILVTFCK